MKIALNPLLYLVCGLTDFAAFVVIFAVSRGLAEAHSETWWLGIVGAAFSFSSGVASIGSGLMSRRIDSRYLFLGGAIAIEASIIGCAWLPVQSCWFFPCYWLLGVGLGCLYPPLIGWLNQGEDAHTNRRGVSRTLILYCVAWNVGMMCGQLTAGSLFRIGFNWVYGVAGAIGFVNIVVAQMAVRQVVPLGVTSSAKSWSRSESIDLAVAFKQLGWIANLGGMFGGSMVLHLLPDLAVRIGIAPEQHGILLACWRSAIIATYFFLHRWDGWHYRFRTSVVSQCLAVVGLSVIAFANSYGMLLAGLILLGQLIGYNYFSGLFYSTAGTKDEGRAMAAGVHEATLATGMATGTVMGGILGSYVDFRAPYILAAVVLVAIILLQVVVWRKRVSPLLEGVGYEALSMRRSKSNSMLDNAK
ncbi:MAG: MFS transporter [Planctomycetota bacterium]|nr:MFS transporter [Planctomycetota bacterium]